MRTYHYTPSVKVYMAAVGESSETYYDVSEDIQTCVVNRKTNAPSDGNIILLNKGNKYNGIFSPFDKIVVFTSKDDKPIRLLTGYITKVQLWTLYEDSMRIYFSDTLYRLNCLYFDPGLSESKKAMGASQIGWSFGEQIYSILKNICGWPESMIDISREVPSAVQDWARELYIAQKVDYEQTEQITREMFQSIMSSSIAISAAGGGTLNADGSFGTPSMSGSTVKEQLWTYFTSIGFTGEATAGIMGNVYAESGYDPVAKYAPYGRLVAIGLFQMGYGCDGGEGDKLMSYASSHGVDWTDVKIQCDYLMTLLPATFDMFTGKTYQYPGGGWVWWPQKMTLQEFSQLRDPGLAAEIFGRVYERPWDINVDKRAGEARAVFAEFSARRV